MDLLADDFRWPSGLMMSYTNTAVRTSRAAGSWAGWVHATGRIWAEPASLLSVRLKPDDVHLHRSPDWGDKYGYTSHTADFFRSVRTRQDPVSPVEAGHAASTLGNVSDIALRLGRKLKWDPAQDRFLGDDEANPMLSRPARSPWTI